MKKTLTKIAVVAALAAAATLGVSGAASAYTTPPTGEVDTPTVAPGGTFTFFTTLNAFQPGETVTISITGANAQGASLAAAVSTKILGTVPANASGNVSGVAINLPANASGSYTVTGTSGSNPTGVSAYVAAAASGLPVTGMDSEALLGLWVAGGALVLAGGGIATAAAVRKNRKAA